MVFSSLTFLFFYLPLVLLIYKLSPLQLRNFCLFIVSLFFYGWGEPKYIVIMLISTVADYFNGYMVWKYRDNPKVAVRFVWLSVVFNLSMLGFFKYFDFFAINLNKLGITAIKPLGIPLPIGISFYTFQTMSYPIDVYRKDADIQTSMIDFGAYVTMFPQLIAGPIVRYKDVAEQLRHRDETADKFVSGVQRFMVGLSKKVLIANNTGMVWEQISALSGNNMSALTAWIGIICYAWQIYFDFSGYSDMAIGLGRMMGFELLENFNYPYLATSITDFWRRWHISLSTWFRDYVYIPLGGNRHGTFNTYRNIFIVWLLTGFWHGASWNFMAWGVFYGCVLMIEKAFLMPYLEKLPKILRHIYTLFIVLIAWVMFALLDMNSIFNYLGYMFGTSGLANGLSFYYLRDNLVLFIVAFAAMGPWGKRVYDKVIARKARWLVPIMVVFAFVICVAFIVDASYNPFLYFRF